VTTARPTPVPGGSRLSLQALAERAGATVEEAERLVELGILAPADVTEPFRSGDILRVRAVTALEGSGVRPEQMAAPAEMPMRLASLVQDAASRYSGRTLKWIEDGVELYFGRPADAVRCSLELRDRIAEADLPGTHVGINAGPFVSL
jgi:hypothetical protein